MSAAELDPDAARPIAPPRRRWTRLRLALAALGGMLIVQLLAAGFVLFQRAQDTQEGFRLPLPAQAAAIASLMEKANERERPTLLSAVNSPDVRVSLAAATDVRRDPPDRLPALEMALKNHLAAYFEALGGRQVLAYIGDSPRKQLYYYERNTLVSSAPLKLAIELRTGEWLQIETRGDLTRKILGLPFGLAIGFFGLAIACFALWIVWRETRPLTGLAARLDSFAASAKPEPMTPEGPQEVRGVIAAFNHLQTRIAELLATRAAMLGALGHDLRTYLTRLRLRAEFIAPPEQAAKARAELDQMERALSSALSFARLHGAALELSPVPLPPLVADALQAFGQDVDLEPVGADRDLADRDLADRDLADPDLADPDLAALADRDALRRVLDNLIENALSHAGAVEIETRAEADRIVIRVMDRGPGWPEPRERLLRPFERGDEARTLDRPGTGLGLAIVAGLMKAMNGEIRLLDREDGVGAVAELRLPRA